MSKIAILIPTFNPGKYIVDCLHSIETQLLKKEDFIVHIALNGSPNSSYTYLKKELLRYSFQYKLYNIKDAGVSNARNFLIKNSKEDYIVFLDDDDVISSNYLTELISASSPTIMGISNIANFEKDPLEKKLNYIGKSFKSLKPTEFSKIKTRKYFSSPCAKMLHRSMIAHYRFDTSLSRGEDSLFMTEISLNINGVKKTSSDTYYFVRERPGSATRKKISKKEECHRIIYLVKEYSKLLINRNYSFIFISSRILATIKHLKNIFN